MFDGVDLDVFRSAKDLVRYVEPVDARDTTFDVFDSNGLRMEVAGVGVREGGRWLRWVSGGETTLTVSQPPVWEPDVLASMIRAHIVAVGVESFGLDRDAAELDLASLVETVAVFHLRSR